MATGTSEESSTEGRMHSGGHRSRMPTQRPALAAAAVPGDDLSNTCAQSNSTETQDWAATAVTSFMSAI